MPDRSWKAYERRTARALGAERIPVTGERDGADWETPTLCVQAKLGRAMPAYLRAWLRGICAAASRKGKRGIVLWKPKHARDEDALVILRYGDFVALQGAMCAESTLIDERAITEERT